MKRILKISVLAILISAIFITPSSALSKIGSQGDEVYAIQQILKTKGYDISSVHMDCGIEMFDADTQDTNAGGSGCGCSAATLCSYILRQIEKKAWKRILFVPTGALLSPISANEGNSVPGIAHGVVIEAV